MAPTTRPSSPRRHHSCPFCASYDVERLYVVPLRMDSCLCGACGERWDEDASSGEWRGRSDRASVLLRRELP